jgi:hypothetical protein
MRQNVPTKPYSTGTEHNPKAKVRVIETKCRLNDGHGDGACLLRLWLDSNAVSLACRSPISRKIKPSGLVNSDQKQRITSLLLVLNTSRLDKVNHVHGIQPAQYGADWLNSFQWGSSAYLFFVRSGFRNVCLLASF